jgi:hypothetical protein
MSRIACRMPHVVRGIDALSALAIMVLTRRRPQALSTEGCNYRNDFVA